jgi:hydrogenase nickel incorporation protein HypB
MTLRTRLVEVRANVLKENDKVARALRDRFEQMGTFVVSLVSSPGAGKTTLLESTLQRLRDRWRVAALVGDLATDNDARRLARAGVPVRQITTGTTCHLEAAMVQQALEACAPGPFDFLFVENVGNLVCPASFDLGEALRVILFSVTEGEDKPLKYPSIFNTSDVALLSKMDLRSAVEFDLAAARASLEAVRPGMEILEVSTRSGAGLDRWVSLLESKRREARFPASTKPIVSSLGGSRPADAARGK